MELIYSMRRKPLKCEPPHFDTVTDPEVIRPLCSISSANIIAFSSPTELDDVDGESWGGHVYVCDLDTPWDCHKVTSTNDPVSALEWDSEGKQILVATSAGHVAVYGQKEFLLNEWTCLYDASFPGEHILSAIFFHPGRRAAGAAGGARYTPTVKGFGGVAQEGALIITSSGVVGAVLPPLAAGPPPDCLRTPRDTLTAAYTEHHNGKILVAFVSASSPRCVRCAAVGVAPGGLALQPLPALYIPQPAAVSWVIRDDTEYLLVAGAALSLWKLAERAYPVHKLLSKGPVQGSTTPGGGPKSNADCFNTLVWHQSTAWQGALGGAGGGGGGAGGVAAAWRHCACAVSPRALHTASHDSGRVTTYQLINPNPTDMVPVGASSPKKAKYSPGSLPPLSASTVLSSVSVSPCGALAVVVDSKAQIHVLALMHAPDIATPLSLQTSHNILEQALVSGHDYIDLLITLKPQALEALYDRITEWFQRQAAPFQQYYFQRWLAMRATITRLSPTAQWSAAWLASLQALQAAWGAAAAALAEPPADLDNDKTLLALEAKAETEAANLQWLRRPLQRALDIGLAAALTRRARQPHSYDLLSDPAAVHLLRKLLVLARGVARSPHLDLAQRALADKMGSDVIEECAAAWGAAPWPAWDSLPRTCISAPHARQRPLVLQYGSAPEHLRFVPEKPSQLDNAPTPCMDSIRYLYLGGGAGGAPRRRRCGRCGAAALHAAAAPDTRFLPACRCGGKWTLVSNV